MLGGRLTWKVRGLEELLPPLEVQAKGRVLAWLVLALKR
jgi:hypothetical protein